MSQKKALLTGYLTLQQAAYELQICRNTAYKYAAEGLLPSIRLGATIRIPRRALDAMVKRGFSDDAK